MCAAVTFQSIMKHSHDDHIHFSFLIKKNCKESLNIKAPAQNSKANAFEAKPMSHKIPNKGIRKPNNFRKGESIPNVSIVRQEIPSTSIDVSPTKHSNQPPDYSSINKKDNERHFKSPAHCTAAMNRNDNDLVSKFFPFFCF